MRFDRLLRIGFTLGEQENESEKKVRKMMKLEDFVCPITRVARAFIDRKARMSLAKWGAVTTGCSG
ncbi:hypothetical protein C7T96_01970 [Nitratireductor sp. StC3]|nr:hypothetical protein C7T96_01970 [Nitratireductor sp. StC3]